MPKATTTKEDQHLAELRDRHFPESAERRWPPSGGGPGWFKAPRVLSVLLQILTEKTVVARGNPGPAYLELLTRVREPGFILLEHPEEHSRIVGYTRTRTWSEAMRTLCELGLIEAKPAHEREFGYALVVNPFIAVRRLHKDGKITEALWDLFYEKWTKTGADVPDEDEAPKPPTRQAGTAAAKRLGSRFRTIGGKPIPTKTLQAARRGGDR